jgi:hypothetical protein
VVFSCAFHAGYAQIMDLRPARIKAQTRKSQKEAARYVSDKDINAIYEVPREAAKQARTRKSKKEHIKA